MIQESLGFWIPRCGLWIPGTGFRLSVAVRFRIPVIRGIPDSKRRIVLPIPVFELHYIGGTTVINKPTKFKTITFYGATHTIRQLFLWPRVIREALLCAFSISWMSLARCGDHTGLAYSKIGRTRDLYKIKKKSLFLLPTVCLSKPRTYVCFMYCFIDMFCPGQVIRRDNSKIFITAYIS